MGQKALTLDGVVCFRTDINCAWVNCGFKLSTCRVGGSWDNENWLESIILVKEIWKKISLLPHYLFGTLNLLSSSFFFDWPFSSEMSWFQRWHLGSVMPPVLDSVSPPVKRREGNPGFRSALSFWVSPSWCQKWTDCVTWPAIPCLWAAEGLSCFAPLERAPKQPIPFSFGKPRAQSFRNC